MSAHSTRKIKLRPTVDFVTDLKKIFQSFKNKILSLKIVKKVQRLLSDITTYI